MRGRVWQKKLKQLRMKLVTGGPDGHTGATSKRGEATRTSAVGAVIGTGICPS